MTDDHKTGRSTPDEFPGIPSLSAVRHKRPLINWPSVDADEGQRSLGNRFLIADK